MTEAQKEQHPLKYILGFKESDSEKKAREDREKREREANAGTQRAIQSAIKGAGIAKKVVTDTTKPAPVKK